MAAAERGVRPHDGDRRERRRHAAEASRVRAARARARRRRRDASRPSRERAPSPYLETPHVARAAAARVRPKARPARIVAPGSSTVACSRVDAHARRRGSQNVASRVSGGARATTRHVREPPRHAPLGFEFALGGFALVARLVERLRAPRAGRDARRRAADRLRKTRARASRRRVVGSSRPRSYRMRSHRRRSRETSAYARRRRRAARGRRDARIEYPASAH